MFWGQAHEYPSVSLNAQVVKQMMTRGSVNGPTNAEVEELVAKMEAWLNEHLHKEERYLTIMHAYMVCKNQNQ